MDLDRVDSWTFEHTQQRLAAIMRGIHERCLAIADEYGPAATTSRMKCRSSAASTTWPAAAYSRRKRLGIVDRAACSWRCDKIGLSEKL